MKGNVSVWLAAAAILAVSCKSQETVTETRVDYSSRTEATRQTADSTAEVRTSQMELSAEKASDTEVERTVTVYSTPDSTGRQYVVSVSTTKTVRKEKERATENRTEREEAVTVSHTADSVSQVTEESVKEETVTRRISWWDINKGKIYIAAAAIIIAGTIAIIIKTKKK